MLCVKETNRQINFGEHSSDLLPPRGEDAGSNGICGIKSLYNIEQHVIRQIA
jgi:hypothetical protein